MKTFVKNLGKNVNVTFPTMSYHYGDVKFNGQKVGMWIQNCEGLWHTRIEMEGRTINVWTPKCYGKQGMVQKVMESLSENRSIFV